MDHIFPVARLVASDHHQQILVAADLALAWVTIAAKVATWMGDRSKALRP
jgi:hypothetical protein